jgi:transcriptional regulator with XRE-family HTH domain
LLPYFYISKISHFLLAKLSTASYICLTNLATLTKMENYGDYFKALRQAKGLTLRDVERETMVSNAYLSQLESGKVKQPSPLTLNKLAKIYEVGYDVLMEKVGYPVTNILTLPNSKQASIAAKIGKVTDDEEMELLEYLKFIRTRKK